MNEQPAEIQTPEARQAQQQKEGIRRALDGYWQQSEGQEPLARKEALEKAIIERTRSMVGENLPGLLAILAEERTRTDRDAQIYLQTVIDRVADFFQKTFTPKELEAKQREAILSQEQNIPLNDLVYFGVAPDSVHIHIAPARTMENGERLALLRNGLKELAHRLKTDKNLLEKKEVTATSWIVAANPRMLTRMGFMIDGPIDDDMRARHFAEETRPVSRAHMTREAFLERYGT